MIRYLTAFVLALVWSSASAQSTKPPCYPLVNGYPQGLPRVAVGEVGTHIYWMCSDYKGSPPVVSGFSCLKDQCAETVLAGAITAVTRASAKVTTANTLWGQHVAFDCTVDLAGEDSPRGWLCWERAVKFVENKAEWLK